MEGIGLNTTLPASGAVTGGGWATRPIEASEVWTLQLLMILNTRTRKRRSCLLRGRAFGNARHIKNFSQRARIEWLKFGRLRRTSLFGKYDEFLGDAGHRTVKSTSTAPNSRQALPSSQRR